MAREDKEKDRESERGVRARVFPPPQERIRRTERRKETDRERERERQQGVALRSVEEGKEGCSSVQHVMFFCFGSQEAPPEHIRASLVE